MSGVVGQKCCVRLYVAWRRAGRACLTVKLHLLTSCSNGFDLDFYSTFPVTLAKPKIRSIGNRECALISAVSMFGQKSRKNGRNILGNCCVRLQKLKVWPISNFAQKLPTTCKRVCKRTPHVTANNVASVCTGLNTSFLSSYPMLNVTWTKISGHLSKTFN